MNVQDTVWHAFRRQFPGANLDRLVTQVMRDMLAERGKLDDYYQQLPRPG